MLMWPLAVVVTVGLILAAVILAGQRLFPGTRLFARALRCPARDRDVAVEFVETVWDGTLVDVRQCSAFTPPSAVDCDKQCLRRQQPTAGGVVSRVAA
jgi:hypothetical protein